MFLIGTRQFLLTIFLLASGLPLLLFWAWPHSAALNQKIREVEERHLLFARGAAAMLANYNRDVTLAFDAAARQMLAGHDIDFARNLLSELNFVHLCVLDTTTGAVLDIVKLRDMPTPERIPDPMRRQLLSVATDGEPDMSRLFIAKGTPGFVLTRLDGQRMVFASIDTDFLHQVARNIDFGEKGHAAIVDADGRIISHPKPEWRAEARDLSALPPVQMMLEGGSGVTMFHSPALSAEMVAGFAAVEGTGWGVMVPQPLAELKAQAQFLTESALLVFAAGLLFSAVLALLASSYTARLVRRVASAADEIAQGVEGVSVSTSATLRLREFETMRQAFNKMSRKEEAVRAHLTQLANCDWLTGLPTKRYFLERAPDLLRTPADRATLYCVDVDNFKSINDVYGHCIGDAVLRVLSARIARLAGPGDAVARSGGDEFLILRKPGRADDRGAFDTRLLAELCRPVETGNLQLPVSCSIGVVEMTGAEPGLPRALGQADRAMYRAKQQGGSNLCLYDEEMRRQCERRDRTAASLKSDVFHSRIDLALQPILRRAGGRLFGFEALARWNGGELSADGPMNFIPLAEEGGFIGNLGSLVRARALAFAAARAAAGEETTVTVNVSRLELCQLGFLNDFREALDAAGVPPRNVVVEMTETIFADQNGLIGPTLAGLKALGVRLWLDDFGKGFSSHGVLSQYPFDALKIDLGFMGSVEQDPRAHAVVTSLIDLAKRLQMPVILERVETAFEIDFANAKNVDYLQGYAFHPPMSPAEAIKLGPSHVPHPVRRAG